MKKALAVLLVILVLVSAAPFWVGLNVEARIESEVATIQESPDLRLELTDYRKGWFSSEAQFLVGFSDAAIARMALGQGVDQTADELLRRRVPISLVINHGPLVLRQGPSACWAKLEARVDETGPMAKSMAEIFGAGPENERPVWRAEVDYAGELTHRLNVPLARFGDDETTIVVRGLQGKGTVFEPNFQFSMEVPSIEVTSPGSTLRIEEIYGEVTAVVQGVQVAEGESLFSVARAEVEDLNDPGLRLVDIEGVEVSGRIETNGDTGLAEGGVSYSIAGLRIAEVANIAELELQLDFDRWDVQALEELGNRVQQEELAGRQGDAATLAPDELRRVSESRPHFEIERLSFQMGGEPFSATAQVELTPPATDGPMPPQQMWLEMVTMTMDLQASKPLVLRWVSQFFAAQLGMPVDEEQASAFLQNFLAQGLVEETEDGMRSRFSISQGEVEINGNPISSPASEGGAAQ